MKTINTIIAIILSLFLVPQSANAQFFKKLEKALQKVEKKVDKALDAGSAVSNTDIANGIKVVNNLPQFSLEYKGISWQKDFCGIDFVITNKGNHPVHVYYFDRMKTFDSDGNEYASRSIVGNRVTSLGNGNFDFEPGVPVKITYALFDLPQKGANMSLCQLRTQIHDAQKGYQDCFIEFRNVPIPQRPVAVSKPFKGEWFLKGNNIERKLSLDFYEKSITGMDAEGNEIKCFGIISVGYGNGAGIQVDECPIISWQGNGNKATVKYIGGRDGNTYQSVLTYNAVSNKISISETKVLIDEGMGECYVSDGLIFSSK